MMIQKTNKYMPIAKRLIKALPEFEDIRELKPRFTFLASDEEKMQNRKLILGQCVKTSKQYEWTCPFDFFIIIYEANCIGFTEHQFETLVRHELNHIGVDFNGNEPSYYIRPHDYEEFESIINDVGIDWARRD